MKLFYKVNALFCVFLSLIILIPMFLLDIPYMGLRWLRHKLMQIGAENFLMAYGVDELMKELDKHKADNL